MRRLAVELRATIANAARAIDVEGVLLIGGIAGIAWLTWDTLAYGVPVGPVIVFGSMIAAGIVFARAPRSP